MASARNSSGESCSARLSSGRPSSAQPGAHRAQGAGPDVLDRAGERLAAVGEGGADQLPGGRVGARPGAAQAEDRRLDPRPRPEDRRVDLAQQLHLAGELDGRARRAVGAAAGRRAQTVGDLALHHHRPAPHRGQLGDRAQDHRRGHRVGKVGDDGGRGGIEPGEIQLERIAPVQVDVGPGSERGQRRLQAPVDLDRVDVGRGGGEPLGQHAFPGADLEHDISRAQLGVAHDRVEQVGIGEEVLT